MLYNTFLNLNLVRRVINTQAISTRLSILLIMHVQVLVRTTSTRVSDLGRLTCHSVRSSPPVIATYFSFLASLFLNVVSLQHQSVPH